MTGSEEEDEIVALAGAFVLAKRKRKRRSPKFQINPYLRLRSVKGRFSTDVQPVPSAVPSSR
jgi:hypothetical protein